MSIISNETLTPRESILLEKETEENRLGREHAVRMKQLEIVARKDELKLRREDAIKARKHHENMKELEYAIRFQETRFRALLRLPLYLMKLPVLLILAIGATILLIKQKEIPDKVIDLFR